MAIIVTDHYGGTLAIIADPALAALVGPISPSRGPSPGAVRFPSRPRTPNISRRGEYHEFMKPRPPPRIQRGVRQHFLAVVFMVGGAALLAGSSHSGQHGQMSGEPLRDPYAWPSLNQLVERSDTIVAGEILDMRSAWTADRREIFTTVTVRPDRRFKGGERSLVRFRIPGGTVGDTRLMITNSPVFSMGEQVLVFLSGGSGRLPRVVAGEAGKRHIWVDEEGEEIILPGFSMSEAAGIPSTSLSTLDDLASAMPGLLAATRFR